MELRKISPVTEINKSVKVYKSDIEYFVSQSKDEGEISLLFADEVMARISLTRAQIRQIMSIGGSKPYDFIQTLAKLVEVGFYEPLATWTIQLSQFENQQDCDLKFQIEEWKVRNYSTSLALTLANGTEIGRATLEFTAPFIKNIQYTVNSEENQSD